MIIRVGVIVGGELEPVPLNSFYDLFRPVVFAAKVVEEVVDRSCFSDLFCIVAVD